MNIMGTSKIKILDEATVNKISAGEVVERPASVVKELVENSIDSGATRIEVELKDGGKALIRVADDGSGMNREEAELSIERHATSKICSANDLFSIQTLGFRGEALPSIGAVSKLEITTRIRGVGAGTRVRVSGGKRETAEDCGCPEGTTIKASDLFFSTPARKKYLKSNYTELSHIAEVVSKYILAYPKISFKLMNNGEALLFSPGNGSLMDAFVSVHGLDIAQDAIEVDHSSGYVNIKGYVVRPTTTRVDRNGQAFFVNGRFVKNSLLSQALEDAYRSLIPRDRHPISAIFINIDPAEVDVNVHPTKREVRFARTNEVLSAIKNAAAKALDIKLDSSPGLEFSGELPSFGAFDNSSAQAQFDGLSMEGGPVAQASREISPVFQVLNTYIVASDGDGFFVVDQHAAHERVLYEELKAASGGGKEQKLLIGQNLDLDPSDNMALSENIEQLRDIGFDIEKLSGSSVMVRSVPAQMVKAPVKEVIGDILSELRTMGRSVSVGDRKDAMLKLVACHSAVKAGDPLTREEISSLFQAMKNTTNPYTCPHGRPTMVRFKRSDLEKMFKRV